MSKLKVEVAELTPINSVEAGQVRGSKCGEIIVLVVGNDGGRFNAVILKDKRNFGSDLTFELNHFDSVDSRTIEEDYPIITNAKMTIGN